MLRLEAIPRPLVKLIAAIGPRSLAGKKQCKIRMKALALTLVFLLLSWFINNVDFQGIPTSAVIRSKTSGFDSNTHVGHPMICTGTSTGQSGLRS